MDTFQFEDARLVPISTAEMQEINGGWWQAALAAAGAAIYVYNNWGDFAAGFKKGITCQ